MRICSLSVRALSDFAFVVSRGLSHGKAASAKVVLSGFLKPVSGISAYSAMDRITMNFNLLVKICTPLTKKIYGIINYIFCFNL